MNERTTAADWLELLEIAIGGGAHGVTILPKAMTPAVQTETCAYPSPVGGSTPPRKKRSLPVKTCGDARDHEQTRTHSAPVGRLLRFGE